MGTQSQTQQAQQIDKKAILAVIKAVAENNSFVIRFGDIEDELAGMVEDEDEFDRLREELLYSSQERLKYIYYIYEDERESWFDRVVVSPIELNESQLKTLAEVAELLDYGFSRNIDEDENEIKDEVDKVITKVINGLVRKWSMGCVQDSTPARAAYVIAKTYNLDVREVEFVPANVGSGGSVTYSIEDIVKVKQIFWYCNDCIVRAGNNFIEKCSTWKFEDNGEQDTTEVSGYD